MLAYQHNLRDRVPLTPPEHFSMVVSPLSRGLELSSLFQVRQRQRGADHVDLWLTNTLHFPLTVQDAILSPESQGLLKVGVVFFCNCAEHLRR